MLKVAKLVTTTEELNRLINQGNFPYISFSTYKGFTHVELQDDEWNKISRVSIGKNGNILGYFNASAGQSQEKINGCLFIKFNNSNYELLEEYDEIELDNDFHEFVDMIMNHPIYTRVEFVAIAENPANKTYVKFLEKYNGERFLMKNYARLMDGKLHDVYLYYFDRSVK